MQGTGFSVSGKPPSRKPRQSAAVAGKILVRNTNTSSIRKHLREQERALLPKPDWKNFSSIIRPETNRDRQLNFYNSCEGDGRCYLAEIAAEAETKPKERHLTADQAQVEQVKQSLANVLGPSTREDPGIFDTFDKPKKTRIRSPSPSRSPTHTPRLTWSHVLRAAINAQDRFEYDQFRAQKMKDLFDLDVDDLHGPHYVPPPGAAVVQEDQRPGSAETLGAGGAPACPIPGDGKPPGSAGPGAGAEKDGKGSQALGGTVSKDSGGREKAEKEDVSEAGPEPGGEGEIRKSIIAIRESGLDDEKKPKTPKRSRSPKKSPRTHSFVNYELPFFMVNRLRVVNPDGSPREGYEPKSRSPSPRGKDRVF